MLKNTSNLPPLVFLALYFIVCNYVVLLLPIHFFSVSNADSVNEVEFVQSSADKPDQILKPKWQSILLPDFWVDNHKNTNTLWYRANITVDKINDEIWAAYLPSVTHNASVYINGFWVGQSGSFETPVSRHHNDPLLFRFSKDLLKLGQNQIYIRVQASSYTQGLMDKFYLAPAKNLENAYKWKHFIRVDYVQWITLFMYIVGLIVLIFWASRPKDTIYGLYALQLFLWATHNLNLFINEIPISAKNWEAMNMATLGWTVVVMIMFNHRYVGKGNRKIEKYMSLFSLVGMGIFFLPDINSVLLIGYSIWDIFVMLLGIYALYYLLHSYRQQKSQDIYLMMLVGIPILALGLHDIMVINHLIDQRDGMTMQFSIMPTILLFSWFLIRRFLESINNAEMLAMTLERRVEEKQKSLEIQYKQLSEFEKQGVLAQERERIMRDMHDGIGGQLISIVTILTEHNDSILVKIREKIQLSISDLRFVIDSLDPLLNDLETLLGTMRIRLSEQLSAAKIELEWGITDLPKINALTPSQSLHIMRIIQEAVTNSIKHSKTKKLTIATGVIEGDTNNKALDKRVKVFVEIVDYGIGESNNKKTNKNQGRGMTNMAYRAKQIDAQLAVNFSAIGTCIRLTI